MEKISYEVYNVNDDQWALAKDDDLFCYSFNKNVGFLSSRDLGAIGLERTIFKSRREAIGFLKKSVPNLRTVYKSHSKHRNQARITLFEEKDK